jgi:hypothetical protein
VNGLNLVLKELKADGFLLMTDGRLPSLTALIAGNKVSGSWWGHPAGKEMFAVAQRLGDHPDVLTLKLISGKVTFVWRSIWNEVVSIALGREEWQYAGLNEAACYLKKLVDRDTTVRLDRLKEWPFVEKPFWPGGSANELEERLLVHVTSEHTETGKHSKVLQTWENWAAKACFSFNNLIDPGVARTRLEIRLSNLNSRFSANAKLPWTGRLKSTETI